MVVALVILPLPLLLDVCTLSFQTRVNFYSYSGEKLSIGTMLMCHLFPNKAMAILYTLEKVGKGKDIDIPNKLLYIQ